jgi:hypothetical protein
MPSVASFKKAFGLTKGLILNDKTYKFELTDIYIGHVVKKIYNEYEFPIRLFFSGKNKKGSEINLIRLMNEKINNESLIVYSDYGNPYECNFGDPFVYSKQQQNEDEDEFIYEVHTTGVGIRRRDLLNLRKINEEKRKISRDKTKSIEIEKLPEEYITRKSVYSTSKCKICSGKIDAGEMISKPKSEIDIRGGWSHPDCLREN